MHDKSVATAGGRHPRRFPPTLCAQESPEPGSAMPRPLYAQINLTALRSNLAQVRSRAPNSQILAVVKANAYGHGLARVLPGLADAEGVALLELDAAVDLRVRHYT